MKCYKTILSTSALLLSTSTNAALLERLSGLAYYDDVANLTWLADANAGAGSIYDDGLLSNDGRMSWENANTWLTSLNVGGVTGWRMPTSLQLDASCDDQSVDVSTGYNCTGNEMGSLYYNALGNTAASLSNVGPFTNVQSSDYWAYYGPYTDVAFPFNMDGGYQSIANKVGDYSVWAVQSGDVGAVPIPAAAWLFGSGLLGLIGFARQRKS